MGYVPPEPPFRLNLDRHGMPRDYATYVWLLYHKRVPDESPQRLAFLAGHVESFPEYMAAVLRRRMLDAYALPEADPALIDTMQV